MMPEPSLESFPFDPTAFMTGQVFSKMWLCETLEGVVFSQLAVKPQKIWVLGGWYCLTSFLLHTRNQINIEKITSFDIDPQATAGAKVLNEAYSFATTFEAHTQDINELDYTAFDGPPDIVINTSTEHVHGAEWYRNIPKGTLIAIQSTDMPHDDHHFMVKSELDLLSYYDPSELYFRGTKRFEYETWGFNRFMFIGRK